METISEGKAYSGSGNAFSRSFLVDGPFVRNRKILHVFDDQSAARHFAETRAYVKGLAGMVIQDLAGPRTGSAVADPGKQSAGEAEDVCGSRTPSRPAEACVRNSMPASPPTFISDDAGLFDFAAASEGEFVSTYGIFDSKRFSPYHLNKKTFRVSVGDKLAEMAFVSRLLSFLYAFQEYSADPWTYRRDGDSVTVRTSRERVVVSFFDGEVDGISVTGLRDGKPSAIQTFVFPDRTPGEPLVDTPDSVSSAVAEGAAVFFHDPDFARHFNEVRKGLPDACVLWGIPRGDAEDLGIRDAELSSEEELRAILGNPASSVRIFSKRPESVRGLVEGVSEFRPKASAGLETDSAGIRYFEPPKGIRLGSFVTQDAKGNPEWFLADDALSPVFAKERTGKSVADRMDLLLKIAPGDYVVHRDHGVGIFHGTEKKSL